MAADLRFAWVILVCIAGFIFAGCSSSLRVLPGKSNADRNSVDYAEMNSLMMENFAGSTEIILVNGKERAARDIQVRIDSTSFIDRVTLQSQQVSTGDIRYIRRTDHLAGSLERIFLGAVAVAGGLAAVSFMTNGSGEAAAKGVLGGLVLGGPVGFVVGGSIGHTYTYEFPRDSASVQLR